MLYITLLVALVIAFVLLGNYETGRPCKTDLDFISISEDADYKNFRRFITEAATAEMLYVGFQLVVIFQENYKGRDAEQKAGNMLTLLDTRHKELGVEMYDPTEKHMV